MARKVAVQPNLDEIRSILQGKGFEVVDPDQAEGAQAFVVTTGITAEDNEGVDPEENVYLPTGTPHHVSYAPVVDATGKRASEVVDEIERLVQ